MLDRMMLVFTTVPSEEEGIALARKIVSEKLAACVQVLPGMTSVYFWEGEVQSEAEHLLLVKTLSERYDKLEEFIRSNHTYDTPEIVAVRADRVSEGYMKWLTDYLGSTAKPAGFDISSEK